MSWSDLKADFAQMMTCGDWPMNESLFYPCLTVWYQFSCHEVWTGWLAWVGNSDHGSGVEFTQQPALRPIAFPRPYLQHLETDEWGPYASVFTGGRWRCAVSPNLFPSQYPVEWIAYWILKTISVPLFVLYRVLLGRESYRGSHSIRLTST